MSGTAVDPHLTGVTVNGAAATVGGGSFSFDMTLAEGANAIVVVATDSLGHTSQTSLTVTLDSVPPVLTIFESGVAFADGLLLGRPAVITVVADDATAVDFAATIDGQAYLLGSPFVTPGAHVFAVTATDEAANSASATRSFTIDNDPPLIDDLSPIPGTVIGAPTVHVAGRVSDDAVEVVVNGIAASFTGGGSNWIGWSIPALPLEQEGLNLLPLRAVDAAGNATEFDISYDRDTLDPQITLTAPTEGLVTRFANLTVAGAAADAHLEHVTINGTEVAAGADGSFSHAVVLVEGPNTVAVVAADVVSQESTAVCAVVLDTAPPVISVTHNGQPLPDGFLSNTPVAPVVTAADDSEVTVATILNGAPFTSGTSVSAEGSYILVATATDAAGNTASLEIAFRLDLTPPAISGLSIADGAVIANPSPMLSGACDDAVSVEVNGSPAVMTAGTFSFAGLTLAEGANQVVVTAADAAGNQRTLTFSVTLDTAPPVITVTAPNDGDLVGAANILVIGTAADLHLHEVTVAGRKAALAGSSFQTQVPLAQEGSNVITITAVDRAGNSAELTVTVERDTTAPVLTVNEPGPSAVLGDGAVTVSGTVSDAHAVTVTVDTRSLTPGPAGAFQTVLQLPEGSHAVKVEAVGRGRQPRCRDPQPDRRPVGAGAADHRADRGRCARHRDGHGDRHRRRRPRNREGHRERRRRRARRQRRVLARRYDSSRGREHDRRTRMGPRREHRHPFDRGGGGHRAASRDGHRARRRRHRRAAQRPAAGQVLRAGGRGHPCRQHPAAARGRRAAGDAVRRRQRRRGRRGADRRSGGRRRARPRGQHRGSRPRRPPAGDGGHRDLHHARRHPTAAPDPGHCLEPGVLLEPDRDRPRRVRRPRPRDRRRPRRRPRLQPTAHSASRSNRRWGRAPSRSR